MVHASCCWPLPPHSDGLVMIICSFGRDMAQYRMTQGLAFKKLEKMMREMQKKDEGIPIRCQKLFLTSIPSVFTGFDLVEWLMERFLIPDEEAVHLANMVCQLGYFFPVPITGSFTVKDDGGLYRFQAPFYWPSYNASPDNTDYAVYLVKLLLASANSTRKCVLEPHEHDIYCKLRQTLSHKWELIHITAENQLRMEKKRKKIDKVISDSQERAFWRIHRPPSGMSAMLERGPRKFFQELKKPTAESLQRTKAELLRRIERAKSYYAQHSACTKCLINHTVAYQDSDPFLSGEEPFNPWAVDDPSYWEYTAAIVSRPLARRMKKWTISLNELLRDPTGVIHFKQFLENEFSLENLQFRLQVEELRRCKQSQVRSKQMLIYDTFVKDDAPFQINIENRTKEEIKARLKPLLECPPDQDLSSQSSSSGGGSGANLPSFPASIQAVPLDERCVFDKAAEEISTLMSTDSYQRFLRSEAFLALQADPPVIEKPPEPTKVQSYFRIFNNFASRTKSSVGSITAAGGGGGGVSTLEPHSATCTPSRAHHPIAGSLSNSLSNVTGSGGGGPSGSSGSHLHPRSTPSSLPGTSRSSGGGGGHTASFDWTMFGDTLSEHSGGGAPDPPHSAAAVIAEINLTEDQMPLLPHGASSETEGSRLPDLSPSTGKKEQTEPMDKRSLPPASQRHVSPLNRSEFSRSACDIPKWAIPAVLHKLEQKPWFDSDTAELLAQALQSSPPTRRRLVTAPSRGDAAAAINSLESLEKLVRQPQITKSASIGNCLQTTQQATPFSL